MNADLAKMYLMEQVEKIKTEDVKQFTKDVLMKAPEVFWVKPSSFNHHHPDERLPGGGVLHTVRVSKIFELVCINTNLPQRKIDVGKSASLIHDVMKYGEDGKAAYILTNDHAFLAGVWLRREFGTQYGELCEEVASVVEKHMGKWVSRKYIPELKIEDILIIADCLEVQDCIKVEV